MPTPHEKEDEKNVDDSPDGGLNAWLTACGAQVSVVYFTPRLN